MPATWTLAMSQQAVCSCVPYFSQEVLRSEEAVAASSMTLSKTLLC